jgi:endonuclease YncB( thermonuclease family)
LSGIAPLSSDNFDTVARPRRSTAKFKALRSGMGGWGRRGVGRWARLLGLVPGLLAVLPESGFASQAAATSNSACRFALVTSGRAGAVVDGRTFMLDDGRTVRVAGIEVPQLPTPGNSGPQADAALAARADLQSILHAQSVELRHPSANLDRYGRAVAHAFIGGRGAMDSVAHQLIGRGYARVSAHVGDLACAVELRSREQAARQARLGLWRIPYYEILPAGGGAELLARRGQFAVVEGKVLSVRESGATIYVNFGRRWSQALTVTVLKRDLRNFAGSGVEPKALADRRIRVRGWLEERSGPRIAAARPEQIEIAERD